MSGFGYEELPYYYQNHSLANNPKVPRYLKVGFTGDITFTGSYRENCEDENVDLVICAYNRSLVYNRLEDTYIQFNDTSEFDECSEAQKKCIFICSMI